MRIFDLTWDQGGDSGLWIFDGRSEVLVEAQEREIDEAEPVYGTPTGEYWIATGLLPADVGVMLPGAARPVFGAAAQQAWARLARLASPSGWIGASSADGTSRRTWRQLRLRDRRSSSTTPAAKRAKG